MSVLTAGQLELLARLYYTAEPIELSPHWRESLLQFFHLDLVTERVRDVDQGYLGGLTEKGRFYVEHLLNTPFPEPVRGWEIPLRDNT